jgi:hypothetical protein
MCRILPGIGVPFGVPTERHAAAQSGPQQNSIAMEENLGVLGVLDLL